MKIAFIGLGVMGSPMAGHLASNGHNLRIFNRTRSKADQWAKTHAGTVCSTPVEAAKDSEIVITCVGDDPDVDEVLFGENGVVKGLNAGSVIVDHTTTSANIARRIHEECRAKEIGFIDAPVSGGEAGAVNGILTVMCGGKEADYLRVESVLGCYARQAKLLGPPGSGQLAKMVNQVCIAGIVQGLAEALSLGQKAGLDMASVIEVISKGAAQSWQMDNRAKTMLNGEFEFGFAVDWMRKDLRICMEQAAELNIEMPVASMVDEFYAEVQASGGGRWDTSSLMYRKK
jgi:3-hydroxyisobutyrate dehydrogenase-like beta-hydroxyacid dehydrogenase